MSGLLRTQLPRSICFLNCALAGQTNKHQYAVALALAGLDLVDEKAKAVSASGPLQLPGVDSQNVWPLITGTTRQSPRQEVPLSFTTDPKNNMTTGALIVGDFKLVIGRQTGSGLWWGPGA